MNIEASSRSTDSSEITHVLTPYLHLDLADIIMLTAGSVWGSWIGGWGGAILKNRIDEDLASRGSAGLTLLSTVLGSDIGLSLTGLIVGGLLDVPPTRFAAINVSGLCGMMLGMLGAGFAKTEALEEGNVIGSLSGLLVGAIVTSFFDFDETPTWDELLQDVSPERARASEGQRASIPTRFSSPLSIEQWSSSAQVQPGPNGEDQFLFTLLGTWH